MEIFQNFPLLPLIATVVVIVLVSLITKKLKRVSNTVPAVPGLPLLGNLHQLKEKKPHQTFAKWGEIYGPIYSIRLGSSTLVVVNSAELAKEALVNKFSSISTRKLSNALTTLTCQKAIVAMSDYGEYHKMVKRYVLTSLLGAGAQKRNRDHRDVMIKNILSSLSANIAKDLHKAVEVREPFKNELFRLALKQALGKDVESVYVEDLGETMSKEEIFNVLVIDPMMGAIEVDWRDFFPYLKWVPNKTLEAKINRMAARKRAVTKALILEQKKRIASGEKINCYVDFLLSEENTMTEDQLIALVWESIIETSDTTLVTTEWAMYQLAKNPKCQERLYNEIEEVCGSDDVTEEHLQKLPYLNAVFHETLRYHSPVPIIPPRFVHEDTEIGGYHIPAGTDIAINLYACNMNKNDWEKPHGWNPERFLSGRFDQFDMYKTMAFGGGKRVCAGSLQAYLISCTAIARMVQEFTWKLRDGEEENVLTLQLTTHKLHPMLAYITPRDSRP